MKSCYLFVVLAVAVVSSEVIDINHNLDISLPRINADLRRHGHTSIHVTPGSFGSHVSFSDSEILGIDSLKRTGNCTLEQVGDNTTLDIHLGYGFFQQSFKSLKINGQDMSASYRIGDNSVHFRYTVHNIGKKDCSVTVNELSFERLAKIDFHASRPEYDGIDLEEYFEKEVIPFLQSKIDKRGVERAWERFVCRTRRLEMVEHISLLHHTIFERFGIPSQL